MYALRRRALGAAREQIHARLARGASAANATAATTRDVAMATTQGGVRAKSAGAHHLGDFSDKGFHDRPLALEHNGGLKEYSVVYTDRAINHMSPVFCETMKNIDGMMKRAYNASGVVIMP